MSITCVGCPSLLTKEAAASYFEIEAVGPMCARFGHIYGTGDEATVKSLEARARGCTSYGNPVPPTPIASVHFGQTYKPRPELLVGAGDAAVTSCVNCMNYDDKAGACAARGVTIFHERQVVEAQDCSWAMRKPTSSTEEPNRVAALLDTLTGETQNITTPVAVSPSPAPIKRRGPVKIPKNYNSDAPVAEEDEKMIRAYRQVDTRKGPVFLPIFHDDFFGDRQALIPDPESTSSGDPSLYIDHSKILEYFAVMVYTLDMNLMMVGEPGSGKTEAARYLAWMLNMPFERLAYTEASEPDQFLGSYQYGPIPGQVNPDGTPIIGTYFKAGRLPLAYTQPGVLLSDEINLPGEAIQQSYRSMNDSSRELVVYDQKFLRHDYCFHLAAVNPAHDWRNIGAKPMASADSGRWSFRKMPNPTPDMVRKVLETTLLRVDHVVPDPAMLKVIMAIGEDLRALSKDGKLPDFWTLRQEVKVARLIPFFGVLDAYKAAYLDFVDDNTKELVETAIRSHIPAGSAWAN